MENKVFSFEQVKTADKVEYANVDVYNGVQRVGSLTAAQILEWVEENDDPVKRKDAGLRLIVRSIVDGEDKRLPDDKHEEFKGIFKNKNPRENGKLVRAILELNGLAAKAQVVADELKNVSSEAITDASHIDSPSPSVV